MVRSTRTSRAPVGVDGWQEYDPSLFEDPKPESPKKPATPPPPPKKKNRKTKKKIVPKKKKVAAPLKKRLKKKPVEESENEESSMSEDEEIYDDGWGEDLLGDERDRLNFSKMTELEKEELMHQRYEERKRKQKLFNLKQVMSKKQKIRKQKKTKVEVSKLKIPEVKEKKEFKLPDGSITLDEVNACLVKRSEFDQACDVNSFKTAIIGHLVRIKTKEKKYEICTVIECVKRSNSSGSDTFYKFGTNKNINLFLKSDSGNGTEQVDEFNFVSNSMVTQEEYDSWTHKLVDHKKPVPKGEKFKNKREEFTKFLKEIKLTDEDIDRIVAEKAAAGHKPLNIAREKKYLMAKIKEAEANNEWDAAKNYRDQLKLLQPDHFMSLASPSVSAKVNAKNRQENTNRSLRAAQNARRMSGMKTEAALDPFARRKTISIHQDEVAKRMDLEDDSEKQFNETLKPEESQPERKTLVDIHAGIDLGFDFE